MRVVIPTSLSEIKLSQYTRYQKVLKDNQDDDTFVCIQMVAIFCNLSVADVMKIPVNDFTDIVESIAKTLGFIPNLDKMTLSEHATADTLLGNDENIPLLMSVLYRPIKRKAGAFYEIEEFDGDESKADLFKEVRMDVVVGAMLFFWTLSKDLLSNTLSHLEAKAAREGLNLAEILDNAGVGIKALFDCRVSLESTFEMWEKNHFTSHSRFYHT